MLCKISTSLFLALAISSASAGIDFTSAIVNDYTSEGFVYRRVTCQADKGSVTFFPPQGWTIRGGKDRIQLSPPGKDLVEAMIQAVPLAAPQPFDEDAVQALEQQIVGEAPPGCQSVAVIKCEENPVLLGQNLSYEIIVSYQTLGQRFQRSVIFVNYPEQQIIFRFAAPKAQFDTLNKAFRRSICSWQWLPPQPDKVQAAFASIATSN